MDDGCFTGLPPPRHITIRDREKPRRAKQRTIAYVPSVNDIEILEVVTMDESDTLDGDHDTEIYSFSEETDRLKSHIHRREIIRRDIAFWMLSLIAIMALSLIYGTIFRLIPIDVAKDEAAILLAPLVGIFATIVGFFFGTESK